MVVAVFGELVSASDFPVYRENPQFWPRKRQFRRFLLRLNVVLQGFRRQFPVLSGTGNFVFANREQLGMNREEFVQNRDRAKGRN